MLEIVVEEQPAAPMRLRAMEYVERKGLGHPDSICDAVMESISVALSRMYIATTGRVRHHNLDKALLVAGKTTAKLGGGTVDAPMRLVVGDRATADCDGRHLPIDDVVVQTARQWMRHHLRYVDPISHLVIQNELQSGSAELQGVFAQSGGGPLAANDTSAAVGFAPLTETEHLTLAAERYLNSAEFKHAFPETGEDVKVMAVRHGRHVDLTVAMAFVDRFIWEPATYFHRKAAAERQLTEFLATKLDDLDGLGVHINTLDQPDRGLDGMYLTVLGTSAENGDSGQVGRGNRVHGLISLRRPMTLEAAAGKNPVSHVGKVYNLLAFQMAEAIHESVAAIDEVYVWLCSRIGNPLAEPWYASAEVTLAAGATLGDVDGAVRDVIRKQLDSVEPFTERLVRGEFSVC